jgi:hypothetical protein
MAARPAATRAPKPALLTAAALVTWSGPLEVAVALKEVPYDVVALGDRITAVGVTTDTGVVVSGTIKVV